MITRERLEELIKQGATIYFTYYCKDKMGEITLDKDYSIGIVYGVPCLMQKHYNAEFGEYFAGGIELIDLYETKEEAEFALRYQNITRTETLSLPTWEELKGKIGEGKPYKIYFDYKKYLFVSRLIIEVGEDSNNSETVSETVEQYFCEGATKENYLEACELCRKLFLGEEVE